MNKLIPVEPTIYTEKEYERLVEMYKDVPEDYSETYFTSRDGEKIKVMSYCRYPSYDMIFAVPVKESWRAEKEIGYFEFRNAKNGKCWGLWVDETEAREIISGFQAMLYESKKN